MIRSEGTTIKKKKKKKKAKSLGSFKKKTFSGMMQHMEDVELPSEKSFFTHL